MRELPTTRRNSWRTASEGVPYFVTRTIILAVEDGFDSYESRAT